MDGYGEFVRALAVVVGLAALTVGFAVRRRPVAEMLTVVLTGFLAILGHLLWTRGPDLVATATISVWTAGLLVPVVCVAVLFGAGMAKFLARIR
ncbi:hypothetical protein [Sphingomonas aerophila]|uniref:Putative membrane protein n=1 Tax=Sphingomonas aerophila TaxID=1344948 RepID=A0A7W9BDM9_9SPHN|nr:hypothetical protein [Sphingomonas aerophila]MBB5715263.1 putative membrane protein [Sphingomonas aerophila]